jgi:hypothetical protein
VHECTHPAAGVRWQLSEANRENASLGALTVVWDSAVLTAWKEIQSL